MHRVLYCSAMAIVPVFSLVLPTVSVAMQDATIMVPDPAAVAKVVQAAGVEATPQSVPFLAGKSSAVFELRASDDKPCGYACAELDSSGSRVAEVILDQEAVTAFTGGAEAAAQRAIGTRRTLGTPTFSHDGLLAYNLLFPYSNNETGKAEGRVAVDILTGRLSLPGGKATGRIAPPVTTPAKDACLLSVPRFKMHVSYRATTLAMLFSNLAAGGFPQVGKKTTKGVEQTDAQYIDDFSKACGACSERSATEIFITDRGMVANIGTYRVSGEAPCKDLADKILFEIDHNRAVYARISASNANHYFVICGYVMTPQGLFLIARVAAGKDSTDASGGYYAFSLPAVFDSAEFVTVALRKDK